MRQRFVLPLIGSLAACLQGAPTEEPARAHLDIQQVLFDDGKDLDLGDLVWATGALATSGINDGLRHIPYGDARLSSTEMYALESQVQGDLTLRSLPEIATGLATRFGEHTLPAEVAEVRRRHLEGSRDELFAETSFEIRPELEHGIGQSVPGLVGDNDGWIGVGFGAGGRLSARVVTAHRGEWDALKHAPLDAVLNLRGFVVPRDVDDIRNGMKPGESLSLGGEGSLGLNFGAGVPLLVANPVQHVTYSIVLSAGASTRLSGELDVQVVRLEGDEAVLDIGLRKARVDNVFVRVNDAFGISGLIQSHVRLGPFDLDLGRIAQHALEKELNRRLSLIEAKAERNRESVRESVARFRIDLGRVGQMGRAAIEEAFKGDIRLAQALAARGDEGLTSEIDLVRAGKTTYGHLGLDLLGMRFFTETERQRGEAVVQTPGGSLAVLFDTLRHDSGSFFSEHGYARSAMAGVEVGADGVAVSSTNMSFSWKEGDDYMERDKMLDQLDGLLALVIGTERQAQVSALLDDVGRRTQARCSGLSNFDSDGGRAYRACKMNVLTDPVILERVALARTTFTEALAASNASTPDAAVAQQAFELALAGVRAYEPPAALAGPPTEIAMTSWYSNEAVDLLLTQTTGQQLRDMAFAIAVAADEDRARADGPTRARRNLQSHAAAFDALARDFDELRASHADLAAIAAANVPGVGTLGELALLIDVPVASESRLVYEDLVVRTVARRRAETIGTALDDLVDDLGDAISKPERVLGPALLSLTRPGLRDYAAQIHMNLDNNWAQDFPQYLAAGYHPLYVGVRGPDVRRMGHDLAWDVTRLVDLHR